MADLELERDKTAVVIMDYQNDIVSNYSTDGEGLLQRSASVLESARQAGIPVVYIVLPRNRQRFGNRLIEGTPGAEVHPAVAPQPGEMVVVKRRTGPFSTTDLDAEFPAVAAREIGWDNVALMCGHEMRVPGGLERCLRVLVHLNTDREQSEMQHVYLRGATALRPDVSGDNDAQE